MKRKRYSEEQIIRLLKEHEAGVTIEELTRKHGVANGGNRSKADGDSECLLSEIEHSVATFKTS
jgi:hypothetical protein